MNYSQEKMDEFVALLERHTPKEGLQYTAVSTLGTYRESAPHDISPVVYDPAIIILGQGKKKCYLDGKTYDFSAGNYLSLFLTMPLEVEVIEASEDKPLLMAGFKIDLARIANILMKMDRVGQWHMPPDAINRSAILAEPLNDDLLDPIVKLFRTLDNPFEREVLSDAILDEIYFRLICNDRSGSLRQLLQHRGQVQQISRVVEHIHNNIDEIVSVDKLADMVNMSTSSFRKIFRDVMHMPPLKYAKLIKLNRAQALIRDGKNASEAGYLVGYNSPAQFSREYKRRFGYVPSETVAVIV